MDDQIEAKDFDAISDEILDQAEKETPTATSVEEKPEGTETETKPDPGAEPEKTEQVKEVEEDESLSADDKLDKIKEILGDDEKAIDAYIKQKGYHTDPAWIKQRELIDRLKGEATAKGVLSDEDRASLEEIKEFRSSAEFIKLNMKRQGFTDDAIDTKLKESGFEVETKVEDDVQLVLKSLNLKKEDLTPQQQSDVTDMTKIARIIIKDEFGKTLPKELAPLQEHLNTNKQTAGAAKVENYMKDTVTKEGILDYAKDIEPAIGKFMDENPDAMQEHILEHFKSINHTLTLERVKTGKKKEERDTKKSDLRQNVSISKSNVKLPAKTGNFEADSEAFFANSNYQE